MVGARQQSSRSRSMKAASHVVWTAVLWLAAVLVIVQPAICAEETGNRAALEAELRATETAFAQAMADRDLKTFASFVAADAVFFGGSALRGREAIVARWSRFFEGPEAPFSWAPQEVVVLDSEPLGLSTGPVHDRAGNLVGSFTSIWRREADGWRIVFDKGCDACPPAAAAGGE